MAALILGFLHPGAVAHGESKRYRDDGPTLARLPAEPEHWLPSHGRECARRGKYKNFCQGPRRVPAPFGPAAELAARLGLGTDKTVSKLLHGEPRREWVEAAGKRPQRPLLWPVVDGKLWRGFGGFGGARQELRRGRHHNGLDIGATDGTPIRAAQSGLVAYSDNGIRGFGNLLMIIHGDASVALYAHCLATFVFPGQHVERGQVIAQVGHTGIARGPHLHFEYRQLGRPRDAIRRFDRVPEQAAKKVRKERQLAYRWARQQRKLKEQQRKAAAAPSPMAKATPQLGALTAPR